MVISVQGVITMVDTDPFAIFIEEKQVKMPPVFLLPHQSAQWSIKQKIGISRIRPIGFIRKLL